MNTKFDNAHAQVLIDGKAETPVVELSFTQVLTDGEPEKFALSLPSRQTVFDDKFEELMVEPDSGRGEEEPEAPTVKLSSFVVRPSLKMILQLGFMALCSIGLALILIRFASFLESLGNWGYVGVAAVEFANSAMLAIPTPSYAYTFTMGSMLNPFVVGIIGGVFAMLGELIGYYIGRKGGSILPESPRIERLKAWTGRWGVVVLFWFAVMPVPFDIAGIWAGAARYPLIRFIPVVTLGKSIKITIIALAGYFGMDILARFAVSFGI